MVAAGRKQSGDRIGEQTGGVEGGTCEKMSVASAILRSAEASTRSDVCASVLLQLCCASDARSDVVGVVLW